MSDVQHGPRNTAGPAPVEPKKVDKVFIPPGFQQYRKVAHIFAQRQDEPFVVETPEGVMQAQAGDYLCIDPTDGHSWPVKAEYFETNYRPVG